MFQGFKSMFNGRFGGFHGNHGGYSGGSYKSSSYKGSSANNGDYYRGSSANHGDSYYYEKNQKFGEGFTCSDEGKQKYKPFYEKDFFNYKTRKFENVVKTGILAEEDQNRKEKYPQDLPEDNVDHLSPHDLELESQKGKKNWFQDPIETNFGSPFDNFFVILFVPSTLLSLTVFAFYLWSNFAILLLLQEYLQKTFRPSSLMLRISALIANFVKGLHKDQTSSILSKFYPLTLSIFFSS